MYPSLTTFKPCDLPTLLNSLQPIAPLLDTLSDVVFFIKDREARYAFVNQTLARRCGFKHSEDLLGRTADMVFPEHFWSAVHRTGPTRALQRPGAGRSTGTAPVFRQPADLVPELL